MVTTRAVTMALAALVATSISDGKAFRAVFTEEMSAAAENRELSPWHSLTNDL